MGDDGFDIETYGDGSWLRRDGPDDDPYPARNLWVHPGIAERYDAEVLCDADAIAAAAEDDDLSSYDGAIAFACPTDGCGKELSLDRPIQFRDLQASDGVLRCPKCELGWFAAKWPPDPIDPNGGGTP